MEDTLLWYDPVQFPLLVYKEDESTPWHNQVEGEKYLDNEMTLRFYLFIHFF